MRSAAAATFESALRVLRAGGTLPSLGVYSGKLSVPLEPFAAGLGERRIITTLCPGGKERMRLMELARQARSKTASDAHVFAGPNCGGLQTLFGTDGWSHQSGHPALGDPRL